MTPVIIGITSGIFVVLLFHVLKQFDKPLIYALILTGIGFIYVGFTWTNLQALVICCIQAVFFLMVAYFGTRKGLYIIGMGYFLHGIWDIIYAFFSPPGLIPPGYDLFCLAIDFTMGAYILYLAYRGYKTPFELGVKN